MSTTETVTNEAAVTEDLCELPFPPASYGDTPEQVEATVQEVIEKIFRDENGSLRSGVFGKTMLPLRDEDIHDRRNGIGCYTENATMPNDLKPLWLNYENSNQAGGKYIVAMLQKYRVTGNPDDLARARQTFKAFVALWENVARDNKFGRGWMPKPYASISDVSGSFESSVDQYTDITMGLEDFYHQAATYEERIIIRNMVLSFADWWIDHDFTHNFMGECLWYKRMDYPHVTGWFLYLNALAYSFSPQQKYEDAFQLWLQKSAGIAANFEEVGISTELSLRQLERLLDLRPEHAEFWKSIMRDNADYLIVLVPKKNNTAECLKGKFQFNGYLMGCLPAAARVFPEGGYAEHIRQLIPVENRRADFYHIRRGELLGDLAPGLQGDDYRNTFFAENHIGWLHGYWFIRELDQQKLEARLGSSQ